MTPALTPASLMCPQRYELTRREQQRRLLRHRALRSVMLGPCMRLQFEDALTLRHQIQEVLRADRASGSAAMQQEIDTYAHLLPDGRQWKATLFIELPDAHERQRLLPPLNEAAHAVYVEVPRHSRVIALANEDLPDRHLGRPSAVHFLRFPLGDALRTALLAGADVTLGCTHDRYAFRRLIPPATLAMLRGDLTRPAAGPGQPPLAADTAAPPTTVLDT